jgi:spore germination protein GerM
VKPTTMNKKIIYSLIGLALIFFITSLLIFLKSGDESEKKSVQPLKSEAGQTSEIPTNTTVKAFFFVEGSRLMRPSPNEIELSGIPQEQYRQFIEILLKGEKNFITPVPEGVTLRGLYLVEGKSLLVVDFSEELIHKFPAGTTAELEFIYFFVNNICFNFKEIKKVKFLISGNEYQTISGHIDIENSFFPDFRYFRE